MGIISGVLDTTMRFRQATFLTNTLKQYVVEPFVSNYIDGIDVESKIGKDFDKEDYSEEQLDEYTAAGEDMAKFAQNLSKYGADTSDDERTIKSALFRMAGRIGECAEDDPAAAGKYIADMKVCSNQLLSTARYVNEKIAEAEEGNKAISPDDIVKWGKEGLTKTTIETATAVGSAVKETVEESKSEKKESASSSIDKEALADDLVSGIKDSDDVGISVDY